MIIRVLNPRRARCPQCRGNVGIDEDQYGLSMKCLMCGRSVDLKLRGGTRTRCKNNPTMREPILSVGGAD